MKLPGSCNLIMDGEVHLGNVKCFLLELCSKCNAAFVYHVSEATNHSKNTE